jgi:transposase
MVGCPPVSSLPMTSSAENAQLRVMVELLRAELSELKAQLGKNSRNSKPPSSDGPAKLASRSLRGKSGRRPGGQKGHPGQTLAQVKVPDSIERHEPDRCRGCDGGLAGAVDVGLEVRQVFDVPRIGVLVREHQLVKRRCGCGTVTTADAPAGVEAPVQYGPNVTAIVLYLYVGQFLSKDRTAKALAELFGIPLSAGTVAKMTARAAAGLRAFTETVRSAIAASPGGALRRDWVSGPGRSAVGALGVHR